MKTILIWEPDVERRALLEVFLQKHFNARLHFVEQSQDIMNLPADVLVIREKYKGQESSSLLHSWALRFPSSSVLVIGTGRRPSEGKIQFIEFSQRQEFLLSALASLITPVSRWEEEEYIKLPRQILHFFKTSPIHLFRENERKEKLLAFPQGGMILDQGEILYILKSDLPELTSFLNTQVFNEIDLKPSDLHTQVMALSNSWDILSPFLTLPEIPKEIIRMAEKTMMAAFRMALGPSDVADKIKILMSHRLGMGFQHAYLNSLIGHRTLYKVDFRREEDLFHFTFASFLCDLSLSKEKELFIKNGKELLTLGPKSAETVLSHARVSHELALKSFPQFPMVHKLILHHHGSAFGFGFNSSAAHEFSPLEQVFILTNDFIKRVLDPHHPKSPAAIEEKMAQEFPPSIMENLGKYLF